MREEAGWWGPGDGDLTESPFKVGSGSLCSVAELQQSRPCPLGKPSPGPLGDGLIAAELLIQLCEPGRERQAGSQRRLPHCVSPHPLTAASGSYFILVEILS